MNTCHTFCIRASAEERIKGQVFCSSPARSKVKDIEVTSNFTRAVAFCQQELITRKLPYLFTTALMRWPTDKPETLKQVCWILKTFGPNLPRIYRALAE